MGLQPRSMLVADRGYDADWIRALVSQQGAWANIPSKSNRKEPICFSPYLFRARNFVERFFNKIEQCRRIATRYDKLAANYLAFVKLAGIRIWLRAYESRPLKQRRNRLARFYNFLERHAAQHMRRELAPERRGKHQMRFWFLHNLELARLECAATDKAKHGLL
jgi:transposase